ncbi:unnamed protein product [Ectocarpus sp. 6 AP-2014]
MRSDIATVIAFGLLSVCPVSAAPTYSCFDPPDEGQTNPLGEGMEDVVESECCEALIDESDMMADREVIWDPVNCNHGPGEEPIAEAYLCRAHDTDGCRFCHDSCDGFEGLCITCEEVLEDLLNSDSPTPSPDFETSEFPATPAPAILTAATEAPFGIFPATPAPVAPVAPPTEAPAVPPTEAPVAPPTEAPAVPPTEAPVAPPTEAPVAPPTEAPVAPATDAPVAAPAPTAEASDCECVNSLSEEEMAVLTRRSKNMVCDPTCSDQSDLVWGVMNCNYFALGQNCRACSDLCDDQGDGTWLDQDGFPCKPCSAV